MHRCCYYGWVSSGPFSSELKGEYKLFRQNKLFRKPASRCSAKSASRCQGSTTTLSRMRNTAQLTTSRDIFPLCSESHHNTHHLFDCGENQTTMTVCDLWIKPAEVASFLKLDEPEKTLDNSPRSIPRS